MTDVAVRSVATRLMGRTYGLPFGIAPMGMCDLSWPGADTHLACAAKHYDVPVCLSSAASTSIEEMYGRAGENAWFQLYVGQSMEHSLSLVDRAEAAGYETLILTVDVPQVSRRIRDLRNGFQVPFPDRPEAVCRLRYASRMVFDNADQRRAVCEELRRRKWGEV
jgi:isopentenyl diphosphate isomerase/L-lactate dehydrogenase-like FMN-dependent dehydrogenase